MLLDAAVSERSFPSWKMTYVTPSGRELATWAGLKNTTTLEDTLAALRQEPGRVPDVPIKLIDSVKDGDLLP